MAAKKKDSKTRRIIMSALRYLVASVTVAILYYMLFALFFSTEEEKQLQKENRLFSNMYEGMKAKEDLISDVVDGLMEKDNAIYEELFDTAPPSVEEIGDVRSQTVRDEANLSERYFVRSASAQSDSLMRLAGTIESNFEEVFRILQERADSIPPLSLPLKNMSYVQVGASVGMRHSPMYDLQIQHNGLDLIAPQGDKVYAVAAGRVSQVVRSRRGMGNEVEIDHGNGYVTRYSLLGDILVTQGKTVKGGQEIGTVGISTLVSAPHLHFEVWYNWELKDPVDYFFASVSPEEYSRIRYMAANTSQSMD